MIRPVAFFRRMPTGGATQHLRPDTGAEVTQDQTDITVRLVQAAEQAPNPRAATVAMLRLLDEEIATAEDNDSEWPMSGDLALLADDIENGDLP